jgi:aspartyl-tRNA(Asn)/glutamyl-tRNA(Gln) amidotransferase subunit C
MPKVEIKDVENVAKLAKLEFSNDEIDKFSEQFNKIVGFVEKIGELDTKDISPTTHAVEKSNVMRPDKVVPSLDTSEIEAIAPKAVDGNIIVPKVIDY